MSDKSHSDDEDVPMDAPIPDKLYPVGESIEVPNCSGNLFKKVLVNGKEGTKPPKGAKVSVHYHGTLESDGSTFDSSRERNAPFEFTLGKGEVIKGWDNGVATMNKGEKAILRCLPTYAYGAAGSPPKIPANSTLNFEVELLDWSKNEDISEHKDKTLMKNVTKEGKDWDKPDYESTVTFNARITDESGHKILYNKNDWEVVIGETDIPHSLEAVLKSMKAEEHCEVHAHGSAVHAAPQFGIETSGQHIVYHVEMVKFHKVKTWEFKGMDKVVQGQRRKDEGNKFFAAGDLSRAERKYKRALEFIEHDYGLSDEEKIEAKKTKVAVLANQAMVQLKLKDYKGAIASCDKCIEADPKSVKALFRRGRARLLMDEWEEAKKDLRLVLEIEPGNADAIKELEEVHNKERAQSKKEKALFGNLFEKLSKMEEKEQKSHPAAAPAPAPADHTDAPSS